MARIAKRISGAYARRMARWFGRRSFVVPADRPIISFTFDDFPRSSLAAGGAMLEQAGFAATYYTATGLAGTTIATGEMFTLDDIPRALAAGHEIGCHTCEHCPAWETPPREYLASVGRNLRALAPLLGPGGAQSHSFPISYPRPRAKTRLGKIFRACRGGGQGINLGPADLNCLDSFFLEQCGENSAAIDRIVGATVERGGWLIFSTHDVADQPTPYGCSPDFFARVVRRAAASGAQVLPVAKALDALGAPPAPSP
jgi:peptidoglycan/xylan/chitin deacetylase (PgdA/CDA1 family)